MLSHFLRPLLACLCLLLGLPCSAQIPQTIAWWEPASKIARLNVPTTLKATSASGAALQYLLLSGPALLEGTELKATNVGTIIVEVRDPGSPLDRPATNRFVLNPNAAQFQPLGSLPVGKPGNLRNVRLHDHFAFVAAGNEGMKVIDLEDPGMPKLVGELNIGSEVLNLEIADNLVYLADSGGLAVVDISAPTHPVQVSKTNLNATGFDVRVLAGRAYLACRTEGLIILDVTDPANPVRLGTYDSPGLALGVDVKDGFAYLGDGTAGLQVVDVSDPAAPRKVGGLDTPGTAGGIRVANGIAYLGDDSLGLVAIDIHESSLPRRLDTIGTSLSRVVRVDGSTVFTTGSGTRLVDVTLPDDLRLLERPANAEHVPSLDIAGDLLALVTDSGELQLQRWKLGLSQRLTTQFFGTMDFTNAPLALTSTASSGLPVRHSVISGPARIEGDRLVLTGAGEVTLQIEQPGDAQFLSKVVSRTFSVNPNQTIAWISPTNQVLQVGIPYHLHAEASSGLPVTYRVLSGPAQAIGDEITVTNLSLAGAVMVIAEQVGSSVFCPISTLQAFNLTAFGKAPSSTDPAFAALALQVVGTRACLVDQQRLRVVDLGNPPQWVELGSVALPTPAGWSGSMDLVVAGQRAYVCADDRGLFIVDISNPAQPSVVGVYDAPFQNGARALGVAVQNDTAYLAAGSGGLLILDVLDPAHPVKLGEYNDFTRSVQVREGIAYLLSGAWLSLVDVSQANRPRLLGGQGAWDGGRGLTIRDDLIALVPSSQGVFIFDVRNPAQPVRLAIAPVGSGMDAYQVQVRGHFAFLTGYYHGYKVVDLSVPTHPMLVHESPDDPNYGNTLQFIGDTAYWADRAGLHTIDVRPRHPQEITWAKHSAALPLDQPHALRAAASSGLPLNYRVVSGPAYFDHGSLVITNLATVLLEAETQSHPDYQPVRSQLVLNQRKATFTRVGEAILEQSHLGSMHMEGTRACVSGGDAVYFVDVSNPFQAVYVTGIGVTSPRDLQVVGNLVYITHDSSRLVPSGLTIADMSRPDVLGRYATAFPPSGLHVSGNRAYLTFANKQLLELNVSDPAKPVKLAEYDLGIRASSVAVRHPYVYLAELEGRRQVLDIRQWNQPRTVSITPGNFTGAPLFQGDTAIFGSWSMLQTWDVSAPETPTQLGQVLGSGYLRPLLWADDLVFANVGGQTISLVEARDPAHLFTLGSLPNPPFGYARGLGMTNGFVFVADYLNGFFAYQTHFTLQPTLESVSFPTSHQAGGILPLPATSPEGFPLRYSVVSGPGQIENGMLRFTGPGSLVLRWESEATDLFEAAFAEQTLVIENTTVPPPTLTYTRQGQTLRLTWDYPAALLETAPNPDGQWIQLTADSPFDVPLTEDSRFFRVRSREQ